MKLSLKISTLLVVTIALIFAGCSEKSSLTDPSKVAVSTGTADFTRFVSIGNSITSGYQSSALYASGQQYSFPNQIAQQVNTPYVQPLISDPGIGGRIDIKSIDLTTGSVAFYYNPANGGTLENPTYAKPFNNLGIPGAVLGDVMHTTDFMGQYTSSRANPFFITILRSSALGATIFQQAKNLQPTFMTLWIGNNDVLGYATSGGTNSGQTNPLAPTPTALFTALYTELVTSISSDSVLSKAKVAVGTIPDVQSIPFFTTVGPLVAEELQASLPAGTPVTAPVFVYQKHEGGSGVATASLSDLATGKVLLTLVASNYAPLLGQKTGKFWWDHGVSPAAVGVDTTQMFGLSAGNPFPDALVLDPSEITITSNAVTTFNSVISSLVTPKANFVLIDVNALLKNIRANDATGTYYNGIAFRSTFITGGLFGLDGVHPSNQGHAIIANQFIDGINSKFGAAIPKINVALLPSSLHFTKALPTNSLGMPVFPAGTFDHLLF